MKLKTQRLTIRESTKTDCAFYFKLINSPKWKLYISDRGMPDLKAAERYIDLGITKSYVENGFGLFTVCLTKNTQAIGICGFVKRPDLEHPDLGFAILPEYERKGYTEEACLACLSYGKETLGLSEILGLTSPDNIASQELLIKIGFQEIKKEDKTITFSRKL